MKVVAGYTGPLPTTQPFKHTPKHSPKNASFTVGIRDDFVDGKARNAEFRPAKKHPHKHMFVPSGPR